MVLRYMNFIYVRKFDKMVANKRVVLQISWCYLPEPSGSGFRLSFRSDPAAAESRRTHEIFIGN